MRLFEMVFDANDEEVGTNGWSFVSTPATELEAVFLSKDTEAIELAHLDDEQIMYAVGLVPNQRILRVNDKSKEGYEIVFGAETIKMASQDFMRRGELGKFNVEHNIPVDGTNIVESWLVKDAEMDKAKSLGLTAPTGSWVLGISIPDKADWSAMKDSGITGISMEGNFLRKQIEAIEMSMELTDAEAFAKAADKLTK